LEPSDTGNYQSEPWSDVIEDLEKRVGLNWDAWDEKDATSSVDDASFIMKAQ
jgi:hypothetical protein